MPGYPTTVCVERDTTYIWRRASKCISCQRVIETCKSIAARLVLTIITNTFTEWHNPVKWCHHANFWFLKRRNLFKMVSEFSTSVNMIASECRCQPYCSFENTEKDWILFVSMHLANHLITSGNILGLDDRSTSVWRVAWFWWHSNWTSGSQMSRFIKGNDEKCKSVICEWNVRKNSRTISKFSGKITRVATMCTYFPRHRFIIHVAY